MNFKEIQELIRLVHKSDLAEFKMKQGDFSITVKTNKGIKQAEATTVNYIPTTLSHPSPHVQANMSFEENTKAVVTDAPVVSSNKYLEIKSPMVGTFYRSPGPDKPAFVQVGDKVEPGSAVCIIEAMKLFNEIESELKGTIVKIVADDASPVEYDQVLFLIEP